MTDLECIEQLIIKIESRKNRYLTRFRDEPNNVYLDSYIKGCEKEINHLQQIKAKLEAWEICKQHSHINNYNSNNKRFDITIWLNTENCGFNGCASYEECLQVKKALEVYDDKID